MKFWFNQSFNGRTAGFSKEYSNRLDANEVFIIADMIDGYRHAILFTDRTGMLCIKYPDPSHDPASLFGGRHKMITQKIRNRTLNAKKSFDILYDYLYNKKED